MTSYRKDEKGFMKRSASQDEQDPGTQKKHMAVEWWEVVCHTERLTRMKREFGNRVQKALKYNANELGLYLRGFRELSHFSKQG